MKISDVRITPVAVPDMPVLNTKGVHGAYFLRSIIEVECDDGTVGLGALYNDPNLPAGGEEVPANAATLLTGNALVGTDMSNDHPVNFVYDAALVAADGGLKDPATIGVPLFGGTSYVTTSRNPRGTKDP